MTDDAHLRRPEYLRLRSAVYDRITGLPSLAVLFDEVRALLESRRAVGLLHVAIPSLALVETVYGWQTFDRVVMRLAAELGSQRGRTIPAKTLLAQLGVHGPEIVAIVPERPDGGEIDLTYLRQAAHELEAVLRSEFAGGEFATVVPRLEPQVGFAGLSENPFYRFERTIHRAVDEARSQPQRRAERLRRSWGEEIQQVIRSEGVSVHYQPVVELETLEVMGYEALSRGPAGSALESPSVLFQVSQDAGLAADLDRLCRRLALASAKGIPRGRKIFLNTRIDQLSDPDWRDDRIERSLARLELAAGDLVVEIAQPGAGVDEASLERLVVELRRRGFRLSIDDIGTGYAGIPAIERLHPDYLKVDISLVRRIDSSLIQQDLVGSLVRLGHRIGAPVIAEGIESEPELRFLRSNGARFGQGFLFSAAVPVLLRGPVRIGRRS